MAERTRGFRSVLQTDLYQLTMAAAYHERQHNPLATFELFVRKLPASRAFLIFAGLQEMVDALLDVHFTADEIAYLRRQAPFASISDSFFEMLEGLRFEGDVWAVPEGTVVFPNQPLVRVTAPLIQAQLMETYLLTLANFSTMVASKAARVVDAAQGRGVLEFGSRRAHGPQAGLLAARAAYLAGFAATSNVEAGMRYGIPIAGTCAHSFIMSFPEEDEAFRAYQTTFPSHTTLLVDTYDTIEGIKKAAAMQPPPQGIRLDSGDLGALAKEARVLLDERGCKDTKIVASSDLNEHRIAALLADGAPIDHFGVGTELATVKDAPALSGVYKLVELQTPAQQWRGVAKNSPGKPSYPGRKQIFRQLDPTGQATGDLVALAHEEAPEGAFPLLTHVIKEGQLVGPLPSLEESRKHCQVSLAHFPPKARQPDASPFYEVSYSDALEQARQEAIK